MLSFFFSLLFTTAALHASTIYYSNDILGELEPCGCRENPLGGMSRKYNLVSEKKSNSISIDAGDLLFQSENIPALLHPQAELQAQYVLKSLGVLQHHIIVPGEKDFALGVEIFEKLKNQTKIKFLSANLKKKNAKPFLEENTVIEVDKKHRVGIFGLSGEKISWPKSLVVLPVESTAHEQVQLLKKKSDLIIAVTHQGLEADRELAKKVPGIDMIIGAHTQSFLQEPLRIGKTTIYQSSFRNQHLGVIDLDSQEKSHKLIELDASHNSKPEALNPIDLLINEFKTRLSQMNTLAQGTNTSEKPPTSKIFHTFPKCSECHLKQFDFWRKTPHALALQTLFQKKQEKNLDCLGCHSLGLGLKEGYSNINQIIESEAPMSLEEYNEFINELHPTASLTEKTKLFKRSQEPPQPFYMAISKIKRAWAPVQCENCHLPGNQHPFEGTYSKKVEKTVCLTCHTQDRAPDWYTKSGPDFDKIEKKRAMIACPSGQLELEN